MSKGANSKRPEIRKLKAKEAEIKKLKGCYGRPSTTKGQRDAARKKKEYLASQEFNKKKSFQEFKQEREVNFVNIRSKYTIKKSNGTRELVKKPKTNHRNNTGTGSEGDESEDNENDEDSAEWCIGDYCRVVCDFDGLVHEAKIIKQYQYDLDVFKVQILGYGNREVKNLNIFQKTRGKKARDAQFDRCKKEKDIEIAKKNLEAKNKKDASESKDNTDNGDEKDDNTNHNTPEQNKKSSKFYVVSPMKIGDLPDERNDQDQDQGLEFETSEKEETGRTALPNGAAAHTVSTRGEETEIEEINLKSQQTISKSARKRLRKKRVLEEKMAKGKISPEVEDEGKIMEQILM